MSIPNQTSPRSSATWQTFLRAGAAQEREDLQVWWQQHRRRFLTVTALLMAYGGITVACYSFVSPYALAFSAALAQIILVVTMTVVAARRKISAARIMATRAKPTTTT